MMDSIIGENKIWTISSKFDNWNWLIKFRQKDLTVTSDMCQIFNKLDVVSSSFNNWGTL